MFLNRKRKRLIKRIKDVTSKSVNFSVIELEAGKYDNIVLLQPIDVGSQVGTDKRTVQGFLTMIHNKLSIKHKQGVEFAIKSKSSGHNPDYTGSEPDFATPTIIYYLEIRFRD